MSIKKTSPLRPLKPLNVTFQMSGGKSDQTSNWNCHRTDCARATLFEIATALTVLEQHFFLLWVGTCIEILHTKFHLRWKIVVLAALKSWVPKNTCSFLSEKKVNFAVFSGPWFFIRGHEILCAQCQNIYLTTAFLAIPAFPGMAKFF